MKSISGLHAIVNLAPTVSHSKVYLAPCSSQLISIYKRDHASWPIFLAVCSYHTLVSTRCTLTQLTFHQTWLSQHQNMCRDEVINSGNNQSWLVNFQCQRDSWGKRYIRVVRSCPNSDLQYPISIPSTLSPHPVITLPHSTINPSITPTLLGALWSSLHIWLTSNTSQHQPSTIITNYHQSSPTSLIQLQSAFRHDFNKSSGQIWTRDKAK